MTRSISPKAIAVLTLVSSLLASAAFAVCAGPNPNVILFIADDLGWSDLPFFTPQITWHENRASSTFHHQTWRPDLNRSAARLQHREGVANSIITIDGLPATTDPTPIRAPIAYKTPMPGQGCGSLGFDSGACAAKEDALEGFGGLRKLADGAVFSRFYAASAVCSPSRASVFTGRHVTQHESKSVGKPMASHQVTIAEYLKQGCEEPEKCWAKGNKLEECRCFTSDGSCPSPAPCYTTGFIGKWHIGGSGEDGNAPWTQGFDEFVGSLGGHRGYFSEDPLVCSPAKYCSGPGCEVRGLYVGPTPGGYNPCTPGTAANDPHCCFAKSVGRRGTYHVQGRKADREVTCNDNSGLARDVHAKRCVDLEGEVGDPCTHISDCGGGTCGAASVCLGGTTPGTACTSDSDCTSGRCSRGSLCVGGTKETMPCASDADCDCAPGEPNCKRGRCTVGCNFAPRVHRDLAKDFIDRHAGESKPFFLVVSFNAVHGSWKGTERAKRHYVTEDPVTHQAVKPGKPSAAVDYWAILEEMDAAIGQIMKRLEERNIADKTLVLFVSDNGRPRGSYGSPVFKGGKGTMFEDGIRLGLLARACGAPASELDLDGYVGGHVDIFPTVAEAAGFPLSEFGDPPVLKSCKKTGLSCDTCPTAECVEHELRGTSFYDLVNRPGPTPPATEGSEFVFAKLDSGNAIISRPGYYVTNPPAPDPSPFPGGVCGLAAEREVKLPGAEPMPIPDDVVRAGSCQTCDPETQGEEFCDDFDCRVLGKVCVPVKGGTCSVGGAACDLDSTCTANGDGHCVFEHDEIGDRCGSCGANKVCREAYVKCNQCVPASWKLKRRDETQLSMWDVATNPEEEEPLDCLDLLDGQDDPPALLAIRNHLNPRLEDFEDLREYTTPTPTPTPIP